MKGLPAQKLVEPCPGRPACAGLDAESLAVSAFMYQNGFELVQEVDDAGWSPLHYVALAGNTRVVQGLLAQRADPDCQTRHAQPIVGTPPGTTALGISVLSHHNDVAQLLIIARATIDLGLAPPLHFAAHANNSAGIRVLLDDQGLCRFPCLDCRLYVWLNGCIGGAGLKGADIHQAFRSLDCPFGRLACLWRHGGLRVPAAGAAG